MNLLKADLFHLRKDKIFWALLVIVAALPFLTCIMVNRMTNGYGIGAESIILQGISADILCAVLGIGISSFVGRDYANNTIRNKLCHGEDRRQIMLVNFLIAIVMTVVFVLASLAMSLLSVAMFGGDLSLSGDFWCKYFCQIAILLAFALMITAVVVCTKSEKAGFIVTVILSVLLTAVSYLLPMLASISGIAKTACRVLYMIVSSMLIASSGGVYTASGGAVFEHLYMNAALLSLVYIALSVGVTAAVVRRQNYK